MKKRQMLLASLLAAGVLASASFADVAPSPLAAAYIVDGKTVSGAAQAGLVPLRTFSEALGYAVTWHADTAAIELKKADLPVVSLLPGDLTGGALKNDRWFVPVDFLQTALGSAVVVRTDGTVVIESSRFAPDEASTVGEIADLIQGKDGIQVLIKGQRFGRYGYDEISLALPRTTPVTGSTLGELKLGDRIYVTYGSAVTKSLPPMGQGTAVEVLKDENRVMGKILEAIPGSTAGEMRIRVVGTADFLLTVNRDTQITDSAGKTAAADTLKEGMTVTVHTPPYATMSMPPQTGANRIVIQ